MSRPAISSRTKRVTNTMRLHIHGVWQAPRLLQLGEDMPKQRLVPTGSGGLGQVEQTAPSAILCPSQDNDVKRIIFHFFNTSLQLALLFDGVTKRGTTTYATESSNRGRTTYEMNADRITDPPHGGAPLAS